MRRSQAHCGGELELFAVAHDLDRDLVRRLDPCHLVHRATTIAGRLAINAQNHVPQLQTGFLRRAITENPRHHNPRATAQAKRFGQFLGQRLHLDPQPAANHLAVLDNRLHDFHGQVDRNRKADALRTTGLGEDCGVDPGQVAVGIHQRAARVARVDRGIGLDKVFVVVQAQLVAPGGADDAHGGGLAHAKRVADRQGDITDAQGVRTTNGDGRQVLQVDLQYREVGFRVAADDPGVGFTTVLESHYNLVGPCDHMVVGQQIAFRAHQHRRTQAGLHTALLGLVVAEKVTELRVFKQGAGVFVHHLGGVQVGHGWRGTHHGVGISHRALLHVTGLRGLLQIDVQARQPNPLRVTLNNQQSDKHASQQWPAKETQSLKH